MIVEAAGPAPGDAGLVYVQIAPPAGSGPAFVDALLAGVRVGSGADYLITTTVIV